MSAGARDVIPRPPISVQRGTTRRAIRGRRAVARPSGERALVGRLFIACHCYRAGPALSAYVGPLLLLLLLQCRSLISPSRAACQRTARCRGAAIKQIDSRR